jgi:hypothetical protein
VPETVTLRTDGPVEPLLPHEIESRLRLIARRLLAIVDEQRTANDTWADAKAAHHAAYHRARLTSYAEHEGDRAWTTARHESFAELASADESTAAFVAERIVRSLNDEAHSLRQVQSSLQTLYRATDDLAGGRR